VLIDSNCQRVKTASETMREAEQLKRIITEEARRRMLAGRDEHGAGAQTHRPVRRRAARAAQWLHPCQPTH